MKQNLLSIIKRYGPHSPLKFTELEKKVRLRGAKAIELISKLRVKGEPICYSPYGYFYATEYNQAKPTIENLEYRAAIMLKMASAIKRKFELNEQTKLFN